MATSKLLGPIFLKRKRNEDNVDKLNGMDSYNLLRIYTEAWYKAADTTNAEASLRLYRLCDAIETIVDSRRDAWYIAAR